MKLDLSWTHHHFPCFCYILHILRSAYFKVQTESQLTTCGELANSPLLGHVTSIESILKAVVSWVRLFATQRDGLDTRTTAYCGRIGEWHRVIRYWNTWLNGLSTVNMTGVCWMTIWETSPLTWSDTTTPLFPGTTYSTLKVNPQENWDHAGYRQVSLDGCHWFASHQGRDHTLSILWERFWWSGMLQAMKMRLQNCGHCKIYEAKPQIPGMEPILCTEAMELVGIDDQLVRNVWAYLKTALVTGGADRFLQVLYHYYS